MGDAGLSQVSRLPDMKLAELLVGHGAAPHQQSSVGAEPLPPMGVQTRC